jgi:hypothetical protein
MKDKDKALKYCEDNNYYISSSGPEQLIPVGCDMFPKVDLKKFFLVATKEIKTTQKEVIKI